MDWTYCHGVILAQYWSSKTLPPEHLRQEEPGGMWLCLQEAFPCYFSSTDLIARISLPFSSFLSLISGFCPIFPRALSNHLKPLSTFLGFWFISPCNTGLWRGSAFLSCPGQFLCLPVTQMVFVCLSF